MESYAACRQRGRAEQFKIWTADASQFAREQREMTRQRQQMKAAKHLALMEATEREKQLDRMLNCQLCDVVQAEAYGLGHADWRHRQCSSCFRATAERLARQRHSSPSLPEDSPSITNLVLGLTAQARLDQIEQSEPMLAARMPQEPFIPNRSRRISSSPTEQATSSQPRESSHPLEDLEGEGELEGLSQVLTALKEGDMKEVMRLVLAHPHLEPILDEALPPTQQEQQSTGQDLLQGGIGAALSASIPLPKIYEPASISIPALEKVREELREAEKDLVFAPTQRERSAALNLAFKLRKELAVLADLDRRERRAREISKYKMREPSGPEPGRSKRDDAHFDPSAGIKSIVRDQDEKIVGVRPVNGCPGLALAARSKARRTERTLQEGGQDHKFKGNLPGYGIVATPSSAARLREGANSLSTSSQTGTRRGAIDQRNQNTHADKPHPSLMTDAVTWRPVSSRLPSYHPPGYGSTGDYDGLDPMAELAKLRSMRVDDYCNEMRKRREWKRAVAEVAIEFQGPNAANQQG